MKRISVLSLMLLVFTFTTSLAVAPPTISYQGILTDSNGKPLADGNYNITFTLYDAQTFGTPVWTDLIPVMHRQR